jgi:hypothetical protein
VAVVLALAALMTPALPIEAHICTPDPEVGVSGRLVLPRDSGAAIVDLPSREVRPVSVLPSQGVATGVASAPDGGLLAVSRFWRRPEDRVGGQDILLVGPGGGEPRAAIERTEPGEVLGLPAWLPDGSLVYERRLLTGASDAVRVERSLPGAPPEIVADGAGWPTTSPDGRTVAMTRTGDRDRLIVRALAGGEERVIVDTSRILSIAFPRFSPDGTWIAFTATSDPSTSPSATPGLVPNREGPSRQPGRTPLVGLTTVFAHGIPWDVWIVRPDGSDLRRVTAFFDDDSSAAWSPDGRWLVTLSAEALHVVALDSSANYCITSQGGYGSLDWLP